MNKKMQGTIFIFGMTLLIYACDPSALPPVSALPPTYTPSPLDEPFLSIVDEQPVPFYLPNVLIIIDDSYSMTVKDKAGEVCDDSGLRYKIGYFFLSLIEDWKANNIVELGQQTQVWFLDGDIPYRPSNDPRADLLSRIQSGDKYSGNIPGLSEIFTPINLGAPDTLLHNQLQNGSIILFITDGDFRVDRKSDEDWIGAKDKVFTGVEQLALQKNISSYFFLLCPRRLSDANLDGKVDDSDEMLSSWHDSFSSHHGRVYGIDDDFSNQQDFKQKLPEIFRNALSDLLYQYDSSGKTNWQMVSREEYSTGIDSSVIKFVAGGIAYHSNPSAASPYAPLQYFFDGKNPPFPSKISPSDGSDCSPHFFSVNQVDEFALLWFQVLPMKFALSGGDPLWFRNDDPLAIRIEVPKSVDWQKWENCFNFKVSFTNSQIKEDAFFAKDEAGNPMLVIPAPIGDELFIDSNLNLSIDWKSSSMEIQSLQVPYQRLYAPAFTESVVLVGQNTLELSFKFLVDLGSTDDYQPTLYFVDEACSLFKPNFYKPKGTPFPGISFTATETGYSIFFGATDINYADCQKMKVQWSDNWPAQYEKFKPADVGCDLIWDPSDGRALVSADCQ
jgi:hypothetical protein